jgi:murein endopeptidase
MCADIPQGSGESMAGTVQTAAPVACQVNNGMFVKNFTSLRLDGMATAQGQCQTMVPDCSGGGCVCIPSFVYDRNIAKIDVWADIVSQYLNGSYFLGGIFGKNPNGSLGFFHVLDSTQPNSTGPVSYMTPGSGSHLIHFQGSIDATVCNMLPNVTPVADVMVYSRSTLHKGQYNNGYLDGGTTLYPLAGPGYVYYPGDTQIPGSDTYGSPDWAHRTIKEVGALWYAAHPSAAPLQTGDISKVGGGPWLSEHPGGSHQNGLNIDMRYVRTDAKAESLNLLTEASFYDKALTVELINLWISTGRVQSLIVHPASQITAGDVPGATLSIETPSSNPKHHNHIHLRLKDEDGPDSNNC